MLEVIEEHNKSRIHPRERLTVSVELEKSKPELMSILPRADVVSVCCPVCQVAFRMYSSITKLIHNG